MAGAQGGFGVIRQLLAVGGIFMCELRQRGEVDTVIRIRRTHLLAQQHDGFFILASTDQRTNQNITVRRRRIARIQPLRHFARHIRMVVVIRDKIQLLHRWHRRRVGIGIEPRLQQVQTTRRGRQTVMRRQNIRMGFRLRRARADAIDNLARAVGNNIQLGIVEHIARRLLLNRRIELHDGRKARRFLRPHTGFRQTNPLNTRQRRFQRDADFLVLRFIVLQNRNHCRQHRLVFQRLRGVEAGEQGLQHRRRVIRTGDFDDIQRFEFGERYGVEFCNNRLRVFHIVALDGEVEINRVERRRHFLRGIDFLQQRIRMIRTAEGDIGFHIGKHQLRRALQHIEMRLHKRDSLIRMAAIMQDIAQIRQLMRTRIGIRVRRVRRSFRIRRRGAGRRGRVHPVSREFECLVDTGCIRLLGQDGDFNAHHRIAMIVRMLGLEVIQRLHRAVFIVDHELDGSEVDIRLRLMRQRDKLFQHLGLLLIFLVGIVDIRQRAQIVFIRRQRDEGFDLLVILILAVGELVLLGELFMAQRIGLVFGNILFQRGNCARAVAGCNTCIRIAGNHRERTCAALVLRNVIDAGWCHRGHGGWRTGRDRCRRRSRCARNIHIRRFLRRHLRRVRQHEVARRNPDADHNNCSNNILTHMAYLSP